MIYHIALYRFQESIPSEYLDAFVRKLAVCTGQTGLAHNYICGRHLPLPADAAAPDAVYAIGAIWEFASLALLEEFSRHPSMVEFVVEWVRPLGVRLAIANLEEPDEPTAAVHRKEQTSNYAS